MRNTANVYTTKIIAYYENNMKTNISIRQMKGRGKVNVPAVAPGEIHFHSEPM